MTGKDVHNSLVVEDGTIKDCPIKETLRYSRVKGFMHLQRYAKNMKEKGVFDEKEMEEKEEHKFEKMAGILNDKNRSMEVLRMLIGKGVSMVPKAEKEEAEKR